MKRTTVINALNNLPENFDMDELLERLVVLEKIEEGLKDAKAGRVVPHEIVKSMVAKCSK